MRLIHCNFQQGVIIEILLYKSIGFDYMQHIERLELN
jgi:hypothetical protein